MRLRFTFLLYRGIIILFVNIILYTTYKMLDEHTVFENYVDTVRGNSDNFDDIPLSDYRKSSIYEEKQSVGCFCNLFRFIYKFLFSHKNLHTT